MSLAATLTSTPMDQGDVRASISAHLDRPIVAQFHRLWYDSPTTWPMTKYRGISTLKSPLDMHIYHELIHELRPVLVIETGTAYGGSALHFADCLAMCGSNGHVVTIDVEEQDRTIKGAGITFLTGSSVDPEIVASVGAHVRPGHGHVLVSLDSDHARDHVLAELHAYADFVTPGSFLVVEDTNLGGHPIPIGMIDGGPSAAVDAFLETRSDFTREPLCERYLMTMHPGGWLRRNSEG